MVSICTLPAGSTVIVYRGEQATVFVAGRSVDLEAVAVPANGDRPAETWADLLGPHVQYFAPDETPDSDDAHSL